MRSCEEFFAIGSPIASGLSLEIEPREDTLPANLPDMTAMIGMFETVDCTMIAGLVVLHEYRFVLSLS